MIGQTVDEPVSLLVIVDPKGRVVNQDNEPCCPFCGSTDLDTRQRAVLEDIDGGYEDHEYCNNCQSTWNMG
jgi:hypothetical protein